ncbi:hypothetical protein [Streptomyces sp. NPDC020681]|uniref:hypothetical protein n=1 Tax=Streptomyces sp. NPDC020681 TaxID=3365083 RepID=UPI0037A48F1C
MAAVLVLAAPATQTAYATDSVEVTVVPAGVAPGGEVEIQVQGCKGTTGAVTSRAFVAETELAVSSRGSRLSGETTVKSSVTIGTYEVSVSCDGRDHAGTGSFKVVKQQPDEQPTPVAPVRAGGGGTAALAVARDDDPADHAGPGTPHTVVGLVLAGVAAVAVALRTSRRRRTGAE